MVDLVQMFLIKNLSFLSKFHSKFHFYIVNLYKFTSFEKIICSYSNVNLFSLCET